MASSDEEGSPKKKVKMTPTKAPRAPKAPKTPKSPKTPKEPKSPKASKTPKEPKTPKTPKSAKDKTDAGPKAKPSKIPTTLAEMEDADKEMMRLREAGTAWAEITETHNKITGGSYTIKAIQARQRRINDNLQVWPTGHAEALKKAKEAVEADMEKLKWEKISEVMKEETGVKYGTEAVQKKWKQIEKNGIESVAGPSTTTTTTAALTPAGTHSAGSEGEEAEDGATNELNEDGDAEMDEAEGEDLGDIEDILEPVEAVDGI